MTQNAFITLGQQGIAARVGVYLPPKMLANAQPWLTLDQFAEKTPVPKNKGETIKWRRAVPFDVSSTTLVEGVTPPPQNFRFEDVTDTLDQYGAYTVITDKVEDLHEDPVLDKIAEEMGKQVASTKELISWITVRGGTQVVYSGTATSRATVEDVLALNQVTAAVAILKGNHGDKLTARLGGSTNYSTEPVNSSYVAVGSSELEGDVRDMDTFVPVEKYGQVKPLNNYEIGKVNECRVILTPQLEPFYGAGSATTTGVLTRDGAAVDVFPLVVMAKGFWGTSSLSGMESVRVQAEPPGKMSKDDPLGQRGFASWKMYFCATRLNENWGVRVETAATDWE